MRLRIAAIAFLLIAIVLAWPAVRHLREQPPPPTPPVRLSLTAPAGTELGSGDEALDAAISPDGRSMVFVATSNGTARLWRRAVDADRAEPLAGTDGARLPAWKSTGGVIAFFGGRSLKQLSFADGAVRDLAAASAPAGASWLPDGSLLFAPESRGPIRRLQHGVSTDATTIHPGDRGHTFPIATGVNNAFVYTAVREDGTSVARLVDNATERELVTTNGHVQLVDDLLLYVRDGVLFAQRYDADTGALTGRPTSLAAPVGVSTIRGLFVASRRLLLTAPFVPRARAITWLSLEGKPPITAGEPRDYWQLRISPDDRAIAVTMTEPLLRTLDVVLVPGNGDGSLEPVTRALAADTDPVWSPDGARVAFRSLQDGPANLFTHAVHRTDAADEPLLRSPLDETPTDWRDGRVLFQATNPKSGFDLWTLNTASGAHEAIVKGGFNETDGRWSPDEQLIAYVSDESGSPDIYTTPTRGGMRVRVSFAGGSRPRWSRDGRALFFLRGSQIMRADVVGRSDGSSRSPQLEPAPHFSTPRPVIDVPGIRDFDVAHRRDAIVALVPTQAASPTPVTALVDWMSLVPLP